jgi:hypothetical protein
MWRDEVVAFLRWRGKIGETGDVKSLTTYHDEITQVHPLFLYSPMINTYLQFRT